MARIERDVIGLTQQVIDEFEASGRTEEGMSSSVVKPGEPLLTNLSLLEDMAAARLRVPVEPEPLGQTS